MSASNPQGDIVALGQLKVGKQIGEGGFGVVHEASLSGVDFPFAIKFLHPSPFATPASKARERFFKEAELLLKLRHPHIVALYGIGEHEGRPYILMERVKGRALHRARDAGPPPAQDVLPFIEYVSGALAYAHSKGVVHRDVKPSNLITLRGDARVLDFGIAAAVDPDRDRLTRTGGTLVGGSFSAPELSENARLVDPRCDIYSVGACWFWLLTGKTPMGGDWQAALRDVDNVSADYQRIVLRCLAQADARYASMSQLLSDVQALRAGAGLPFKPDELTDDDALVLGAIASACPLPGDSTSAYGVERALAPLVTPLALSISHRKLLRLKLIETFRSEDWNDNVSWELRLSGAGEEWVERHQARVAALMLTIRPTPPELPADEIPF